MRFLCEVLYFTYAHSSELVAILKALSDVAISRDVEYVILSDSLSSLLAQTSFYPSDPFLVDILTRPTAIHRRGKSVRLFWIPSHVGVSGNERSDSAAKWVARRPQTRVFSTVRQGPSFGNIFIYEHQVLE